VIEIGELPPAPTTSAFDTIRTWSRRHVLVAGVAAVLVALAIGLPTDVIPNPVFGRPVPVTWWSYPTLAVTAVLGGLLAATYVSDRAGSPTSLDDMDAPTRRGGIAGLLSFFAVGCPVCNKLVIVALGTTGARQWFEPIQPALAVASIVLLAWALRGRLRSSATCRLD
jgi:hypothetical protein